ncbi:sigma-70 family RNA polymerase sigma factor [Eubacteriales bacterium OttesenSCG-928-N13]|nr:sigma-70 family RNA polymerase sigma factor [Eubacteriales bacterium OttesenSCG-928-N13]
MKIRYRFANEIVEIEVEDGWGAVLIDLDRQERNNNQTETRRHVSYDMVTQEQGMQFAEPSSLPESTEIGLLMMALDSLSEAQRELICAVLWEGRTVSDYARSEGVLQSAISHRLQTIYRKLREILRDPHI